MKLWFFASKSVENIRIGCNAGKWAVSDIDETSMKGRYTKSKKMHPGDFGPFYCSEDKCFTVPFKVLSPAQHVLDYNTWPGPKPWGLPFAIEPLGPPERRVALTSAMHQWKALRDVPNSTWRLRGINGITAFVSTDIPEEDWDQIMIDLGYHTKNA